MRIQQLVNEGGLKNCNELRQEFEITVMQYNMIMSVIPREWKKEICKKGKTVNARDKYDDYKDCAKVAAIFYKKKILENHEVLNVQYKKISKIIKVDFEMFCEAFRNMYLVTNVTKLRSFQYRLLNCAIILNDKLFHWKIKETNLCSNCGIEKEEIMHFLIFCEKSKNIWMQVEIWCRSFAENDIFDFNSENVILNLLNPNPGHLFNTICLTVKQLMYAYRCLGKMLDITVIKKQFEQHERYEWYAACQNQNQSKHIKKWALFYRRTPSVYNNCVSMSQGIDFVGTFVPKM